MTVHHHQVVISFCHEQVHAHHLHLLQRIKTGDHLLGRVSVQTSQPAILTRMAAFILGQ